MSRPTPHTGRPREKNLTGVILFFTLLFIEGGILAWLALTRRCGVHDTFQHFNNLYYFLNNACLYGEIPQWIPFIMQGIPASHIYCLQDGSGLLFQILYMAGGLIKNLNALPIFYADIFINETLLLMGTWLWAKRTFSSYYTVFFVAAGVIGSAVWYSQVYFNFAFFTAIPLIIYFLHCFFDTRQWRYLWAAFNLWIIHSLSIHAYFIPVTSFIIFTYFFFDIPVHFKEYKQAVRSLRWRSRSCLACLAGMALSAALFSVLFIAKDPEVISFTPGRSNDGTVLLPVFLTHGGATQAGKWIELFLRQSWLWDLTLYSGLLTVCLFLSALVLVRQKKILPFLFSALTITALTMAGPVSKTAYYLWPLMKYFRHIGLISSIVRIFLCFLAGFGFEAFFLKSSGKTNRLLLASLSGGLIMLTCFYLWCARDITRMTAVRAFILDRQLRLSAALVEGQFTSAAIFSALFALFCLLFMLLKNKIPVRVFMLTVLCLHLVDLYGYKINQALMRTVRLTEPQYQGTFFQPVPFIKRRSCSAVSARAEVFRSFLKESGGAVYCNANAFLFIDELGSSFIAHVWLKALDNYFRAYGGQPLATVRNTLPPGYKNRRITFPSTHPGALKISGVNEDKIQFFSNAYISQDASTAAQMTDKRYAGDRLFVAPPVEDKNALPSPPGGQADNSTAPQRLLLPYKIVNFSSNHLRLTVDTRGRKKAWLLYADAWHPAWTASVNGFQTPVFKANLAYKAVPLKPGLNDVQFDFYSPRLALLQRLIGICALGWLGAMGALLKRL